MLRENTQGLLFREGNYEIGTSLLCNICQLVGGVRTLLYRDETVQPLRPPCGVAALSDGQTDGHHSRFPKTYRLTSGLAAGHTSGKQKLH